MRRASPLVASADAVVLDTTGTSVEAVVKRILEIAGGRLSI
jgi:cytidylate kinase